jgi:CRISPR system Cascade subunit CasA
MLRNLLFEDGFMLTPLQRPAAGRDKQSCNFSAAVLVRGQGTTHGFHQAIIPIPTAAARNLFCKGPERNRLADQSKTALNDSSVMQNRVLKPAVLSLLEAGPDQIDFDKREISAWWEAIQQDFAAAWAADFFPWLWTTVDNPDSEAARLDWLKALHAKAKDAFEAAVTRYPHREGRRYRARVRAENFFFGSLFKQFPQLKERPYERARSG